jgi:hypothetical protein
MVLDLAWYGDCAIFFIQSKSCLESFLKEAHPHQQGRAQVETLRFFIRRLQS